MHNQTLTPIPSATKPELKFLHVATSPFTCQESRSQPPDMRQQWPIVCLQVQAWHLSEHDQSISNAGDIRCTASGPYAALLSSEATALELFPPQNSEECVFFHCPPPPPRPVPCRGGGVPPLVDRPSRSLHSPTAHPNSNYNQQQPPNRFATRLQPPF